MRGWGVNYQRRSPACMNATDFLKRIKAQPVVECAETGDIIASRVDRHNTCKGREDQVLYWYIPESARHIDDLVRIEVTELASCFFLCPIHPVTRKPITPFKPYHRPAVCYQD